jgi:predicted nucleotidyltransferase
MDRGEYSRERIEELGSRLTPVTGLLRDQPLCIYATGSYGRLEAGEESDIDIFFLYEGHPRVQRLPNLTLIQLSACLIEATAAMGFPEFSEDGRYLDVHYLDHMEEVLGSPDDDSRNAFTARMLLLLESRPVYGPERYDRILRKVVGFYYRDFDDHREKFRPTFLINDILRFWRTLTLNYEHDRYEVRKLPEDEQIDAKAKSALKNYKLKVSRLSTCFSMVLHLASEEPPVNPERVLELCALTPRERFENLQGMGNADADRCVEILLSTYDAFLDHVQRPRPQVLEDFRDAGARAVHLREAGDFGKKIFELLTLLVPQQHLRHLVV